jgi:hypothetical protein
VAIAAPEAAMLVSTSSTTAGLGPNRPADAQTMIGMHRLNQSEALC